MKNLILIFLVVFSGAWAAASELVFEAEGLSHQTPRRLTYSFDKTTLQGQITATYKGKCSRVKMPCVHLEVNLVFDVPNLTFDKRSESLIYNDGEVAALCARKNWAGFLRPTDKCKFKFTSDAATGRGIIGLVI